MRNHYRPRVNSFVTRVGELHFFARLLPNCIHLQYDRCRWPSSTCLPFRFTCCHSRFFVRLYIASVLVFCVTYCFPHLQMLCVTHFIGFARYTVYEYRHCFLCLRLGHVLGILRYFKLCNWLHISTVWKTFPFSIRLNLILFSVIKILICVFPSIK